MKFIYILLTAIILTHCSKIQIGDWSYDPKATMIRLTFGVSK